MKIPTEPEELTDATMSIQIRWIASLPASCLHAAAVMRAGQPTADTALSDTLAESVDSLAEEIHLCGLPERPLLEMLAALSSGIANPLELATLALVKICGRNDKTDQRARRLAGRIADLEAIFRRRKPGLVDELLARAKPLKQEWDGWGRRLLVRLKQTTDALLIAERADVVLVHPICGGYGVPHPAFNSARIEVVPAQFKGRLPEVVRLAWLIAQLQCDLPVFSEQLPVERRQPIAALAMVPVVLDAVTYVQQDYDETSSVAHALVAWRLAATDAEAAQRAPILTDWWQTYLEQPPHWSVALLALDQMLASVDKA